MIFTDYFKTPLEGPAPCDALGSSLYNVLDWYMRKYMVALCLPAYIPNFMSCQEMNCDHFFDDMTCGHGFV